MRKKHVLPALLLSVTTSFNILSFSACNTTNSSAPENTEPTYYEESDTQKTEEIHNDTGNGITDTLNYDGSRIKRGILLDDTDTVKRREKLE